MPTNILTAGTTAAQSSDFDLAAGEEAHIHLFSPGFAPAVPHVTVDVLIKDSGGGYTVIEKLTQDKVGCVITGAGTYAVSRPVTMRSVGVDRD